MNKNNLELLQEKRNLEGLKTERFLAIKKLKQEIRNAKKQRQDKFLIFKIFKGISDSIKKLSINFYESMKKENSQINNPNLFDVKNRLLKQNSVYTLLNKYAVLEHTRKSLAFSELKLKSLHL